MNKKGIAPLALLLLGGLLTIAALVGIMILADAANKETPYIVRSNSTEAYMLTVNGTLILQPNGYTHTCDATTNLGALYYNGSNYYACTGAGGWVDILTAAAETDPQVGLVTATKWCVADGLAIQCNTDPPESSNNYTTTITFTNTSTNVTLLLERNGMPNLTATFPYNTYTDTNNYTTHIWNTENGNDITIHLNRSGTTEINTTFTDSEGITVETDPIAIAAINQNSTAFTNNITWLKGLIDSNSTYFTSNYLLTSDQRYNDTIKIDQNSTAIFNNITWLKGLIDANSTYFTSNYLLTSDQRYNDTSKIDQNSTAFFNNITWLKGLIDANSTYFTSNYLLTSDQRYNDTSKIDQNSTAVFNNITWLKTLIDSNSTFFSAIGDKETANNISQANIINTKVNGTGNAGKIAKFTGSQTIGDSVITEYANNTVNIAGILTTTNDTILGGDLLIAGSIVNVNGANVTGSMIPATDNTFDIGSTNKSWRNVYAITFYGNLNASYIINAPWLLSSDQRYNESTKIDQNSTAFTNNITWIKNSIEQNSTAFTNNITWLKGLIDTNSTTFSTIGDRETANNQSQANLINLKLNITDQRYNDSAYALSLLTTTYYNATSINSIVGTLQGQLSDLHGYDDKIYNISESSSDINVNITYTGVTNINQIVIRYKTILGEGHTITLWLWDYATNNWESYALLTDTSGNYIVKSIGVFDSSNHLSAGVVQIKINTTNVGASTDKWEFDWFTISTGVATPAGVEIDPYSIHTNGDIPLTANWNAGNYNITANEINASLNYSKITNKPELVINGSNANIRNLTISDTLIINRTLPVYIWYYNSTFWDCLNATGTIYNRGNASVVCA